MTTKELEKKLKISENTCIHCPTLELAKQVLNIFHQVGLIWCSGKHYIRYTNWDKHKGNTVYYPFDGEVSSLEFAHRTNYKIINAEEFIVIHTEEKEFDLENYIPKGDLTGFPKEIIARMLEYQEEQGNKRDISVFEKDRRTAGGEYKCFYWNETKEGFVFWNDVINNKNFDLFFEKYPQKDHDEPKTAKYVQVGDNAILSDYTSAQSSVEINTTEENQDFKLGDKVYDIMCKSSGIITNVSIGRIEYPLTVNLENGKINTYTIDGRVNSYYETPQLLHYRDNYDYSIIDFNNLPKRQEPKRWRAKVGGKYYSFTSNFKVEEYIEDNDYYYDNNNYNSGNYFQTEKEAQEVADKLNKYFQELINPKK